MMALKPWAPALYNALRNQFAQWHDREAREIMYGNCFSGYLSKSGSGLPDRQGSGFI